MDRIFNKMSKENNEDVDVPKYFKQKILKKSSINTGKSNNTYLTLESYFPEKRIRNQFHKS